jgi:hypothetical protein
MGALLVTRMVAVGAGSSEAMGYGLGVGVGSKASAGSVGVRVGRIGDRVPLVGPGGVTGSVTVAVAVIITARGRGETAVGDTINVGIDVPVGVAEGVAEEVTIAVAVKATVGVSVTVALAVAVTVRSWLLTSGRALMRTARVARGGGVSGGWAGNAAIRGSVAIPAKQMAEKSSRRLRKSVRGNMHRV